MVSIKIITLHQKNVLNILIYWVYVLIHAQNNTNICTYSRVSLQQAGEHEEGKFSC
jgi:hypothetical protein